MSLMQGMRCLLSYSPFARHYDPLLHSPSSSCVVFHLTLFFFDTTKKMWDHSQDVCLSLSTLFCEDDERMKQNDETTIISREECCYNRPDGVDVLRWFWWIWRWNEEANSWMYSLLGHVFLFIPDMFRILTLSASIACSSSSSPLS